MKTFSSLLLIGFAIILLAPRMASTANAAENRTIYCGSGFAQYLAPDDVADCSPGGTCHLHDVCHDRCGKDGDLYGGTYYIQSKKSETRNISKQ